MYAERGSNMRVAAGVYLVIGLFWASYANMQQDKIGHVEPGVEIATFFVNTTLWPFSMIVAATTRQPQ